MRNDLLLANGSRVVDLFNRFDEHFHPNHNNYRRDPYYKTKGGALLKLQNRIDKLACESFLKLASLIPIPVYVKGRVSASLRHPEEDPSWQNVLDIVVFAQLWHPSLVERLELVSFLLENDLGLSTLH